jgi:hypothetical protein
MKKLLLYLASLLGEIASSIGLNSLCQKWLSQLLFRIVINKLGQLASSGEGEGTDTLAHQFGEEEGGLGIAAATSCFSFINKRGIPEDKVLRPMRGAILINYLKGQSHQPLDVLLGIGNGGGAADKLGMGSIEGTNALQSS